MPKKKNRNTNGQRKNGGKKMNGAHSTKQKRGGLQQQAKRVMVATSEIVFGDTWPTEMAALVTIKRNGGFKIQPFDWTVADSVFEGFVLDDDADGLIYLEHFWFSIDQRGYKIKPEDITTIPGRQITLMHRDGTRWSVVVFPNTDLVMDNPAFHQDSSTVRMASLLTSGGRIPSRIRAQASLAYAAYVMSLAEPHQIKELTAVVTEILESESAEVLLSDWFGDIVSKHLAESDMKTNEVYRAENDVLNLLSGIHPRDMKVRLLGRHEKSDVPATHFDRLFGLAA